MSPQEVCGRGWLLPREGERGGAASEMGRGEMPRTSGKEGKGARGSDGRDRRTGPLQSEWVRSDNERLRGCPGGG